MPVPTVGEIDLEIPQERVGELSPTQALLLPCRALPASQLIQDQSAQTHLALTWLDTPKSQEDRPFQGNSDRGTGRPELKLLVLCPPLPTPLLFGRTWNSEVVKGKSQAHPSWPHPTCLCFKPPTSGISGKLQAALNCVWSRHG
jgi:hypothetical protein